MADHRIPADRILADAIAQARPEVSATIVAEEMGRLLILRREARDARGEDGLARPDEKTAPQGPA